MDIKEIALKVGLQAFEEHPYDEGHVVSPSGYTWIDDKLIEFSEALIAAYKAELLKEAGEPVNACPVGVALNAVSHVGAANYDHREREARRWIYEAEKQLFTSDQVAAAIIKATGPLEDQLAKAEQRVAEACAAYVLDDLDGFEDGDCIAEAIRSGEWRKFVKEV